MERERGERPKTLQAPSNRVPPAAEKPVYAPPINWWKLDAEERTETLQVLFEWVPELVRRYGLRDSTLPPCWYKHEAMIQELLALFQLRNQQMFLPIAPPSAPSDFHYQFQLFQGRMLTWNHMSGCNGSEHNDTVVQLWADPYKPAAAAWDVDAHEYVMEAQHRWAKEETE